MYKRQGIYIASKTRHAEKWRQLRDSGIPIISTWIDEAGVGETADYSDLWWRCIDEARNAKVLILYREDGETLKGALVEVGAALASDTLVITVGCTDVNEYSWLNHLYVHMCISMDSALAKIKEVGNV